MPFSKKDNQNLKANRFHRYNYKIMSSSIMKKALQLIMDWRIKCLVQKVLSILPLGEKVNFVFQNELDKVLTKTYDGRVRGSIEHFGMILNENFSFNQSHIIEIGTGWVPIDTFFLYFLGAKQIDTIDYLLHVRHSMSVKIIKTIRKQFASISRSFKIPIDVLEKRFRRLKADSSLETLFESANIRYFAPADFSEMEIPSNSIDLIHTNGVLEHFQYDLIISFLRKCKDILRTGGYMLHSIGLHDHNVRSNTSLPPMNFLRYGNAYWQLFQSKFTYQNRLRAVHHLGLFKKFRFKIVKTNLNHDPEELNIVKQMKVASEFKRLSPKNLAIRKAVILAKKTE